MKHIKSYNIFESVKSLDYIYDTYYSDMKRLLFDKIIKSDPTTKPNKMGVYCKWLLGLMKSKKLKFEDLYKAPEYLKLYHRFKHTLPVEQRNIDNIENLAELAKIIEPFKEPASDLLSSEENKKKAFVKSFENFDLYIPKTYEESRDLGRGTEWCTAADSDEGRARFNRYKNYGELYIFISKIDKSEKFQFHVESEQYMDKYDKKINLIDFLNSNPDIKEYLSPHLQWLYDILELKFLEKITFEKYPDSVFFIFTHNKFIVMEYDTTDTILFVSFNSIWHYIEISGSYDFMDDVKKYIKDKMMEKFNIVTTPITAKVQVRKRWDDIEKSPEGYVKIRQNNT